MSHIITKTFTSHIVMSYVCSQIFKIRSITHTTSQYRCLLLGITCRLQHLVGLLANVPTQLLASHGFPQLPPQYGQDRECDCKIIPSMHATGGTQHDGRVRGYICNIGIGSLHRYLTIMVGIFYRKRFILQVYIQLYFLWNLRYINLYYLGANIFRCNRLSIVTIRFMGF